MKKKKGSGKGGGKKKTKKGCPSPEDIERKEFYRAALALRERIQHETELEQRIRENLDSLRASREIDQQSLAERKRDLAAKDQRLRRERDEHAIVLGKQKRNLKTLLFDHQDDLANKMTVGFAKQLALTSEHDGELGQLSGELQDVADSIKDTTISYDRFNLDRQKKANDEATLLRNQAGHRIAALATAAEEQSKRVRDESARTLAGEMSALSEQSLLKVENVLSANSRQLEEMRSAYKAALESNLDTIVELRKEAMMMKEREQHGRQILNELQLRNDEIIGPLELGREELARLEVDAKTFFEQRKDLDSQKRVLSKAEDELRTIQWDHEVLFQKFQALESERSECLKKLQSSVHSARQVEDFTSMLCERRLKRSIERGQAKSAAIVDLLRRADVDLGTINTSSVPITDVLAEKEEVINRLGAQLKIISDAKTAMKHKHIRLIEDVKSKRGA